MDINVKDCIHLQSVQTPDSHTLESRNANLLDWYLLAVKSMQDKLHEASRYIVADAYFSKNSFAVGLQAMEFELISRFRHDAVLFYPTLEKPRGKRGRPKLYVGKIDMANLVKSRVQKIDIDKEELYTLIAYSKSLKQNVRLAIWYSKEERIPSSFYVQI